MSGSFRKSPRKSCSSAIWPSALPGSVIATKRLPASSSPTASRTRAWKYSNCDRVSMVPPLFEETTNSVFDRSTACSVARIASASVESRTCRVSAPSALPNERRSAQAAEHGVGQPVVGAGLRELAQLVGVLEHRLADRQPAKPVRQLGRVLVATPERRVLAPDPLRHLLVGRALDALGDLRL